MHEQGLERGAWWRLRRQGAAQVRCETFNGQEVRNLATFAELIDGCSDKYMKFGLEGGKLVILDRLQANDDAPRILQQHAITFDRSADLRCTSWSCDSLCRADWMSQPLQACNASVCACVSPPE